MMPSTVHLLAMVASAGRTAKGFALPLLAAAALACGSPGEGRTEVRVAAAASLRLALQDIAVEFKTSHPEVEVLINSAASGTLRRQIEFGDAADLFISANERHIEGLVEAGRIDAGDIRILCGNRLVVGTPAGEQVTLEDLGDEARWARIGIANPRTAPLGEFAREALGTRGLWEVVEPRLIFAENATQLANYIRLGSVNAAIVYASDWRNLGHAVEEEMAVDPALHAPIRYPMAPVQGSPVSAWAHRLMAHLIGEGSQRTLSDHGFLPAASLDASAPTGEGQG